MTDRRWRLSAESITAVSAVVAALVALAVGVWENAQERRHNRLSVFPSLEYVAVLQTENFDSAGQAVIRIVNEGVGPAVIDDVRIRVREPGGPEREYRTWAEAAPVLEALGVEITGRAELGEGMVMGIGRERDLVTFELTTVEEPGEAVQVFTRLLEQIGMTIVYRSIYGDEYVATLDRGGG